MTDQVRESTERGRFVVLDGVDGCGKTTQATRLFPKRCGRCWSRCRCMSVILTATTWKPSARKPESHGRELR